VVKRALLGLVKGTLIGALVAAALVKGLGLVAFGGVGLALLAAAISGALAGLLVGRPLWAPNARVEAGLKALAGALLGAGVLLLVRRLLPVPITLPAELGAGPIGELPVVMLPLVAALLGALFEVDHTGDAASPSPERARSDGAVARRGPRVVAAPEPPREDAAVDEALADSPDSPDATTTASPRHRPRP